MEEKLEDKSNNEIGFLIKKLETEHESLKSKILRDFDELLVIEAKYLKLNNILLDRQRI